MKKDYSFQIKVNGIIGTYSFSIPYENGAVITNEYCPMSLLTYDSPIVVEYVSKEPEDEFLKDCTNIVKYVNSCPNRPIAANLGQATFSVMCDHINMFGRLIFHNMLKYMDCDAYLLKAVGFPDSEIKEAYPQIVKGMVDLVIDAIKDSYTLLPFRQSPFYQTLCKLANQ